MKVAAEGRGHVGQFGGPESQRPSRRDKKFGLRGDAAINRLVRVEMSMEM